MQLYLALADVVYPPSLVKQESFMVEAESETEALEKLKAWLKTSYSGRRDCYIRKDSEIIRPYIK